MAGWLTGGGNNVVRGGVDGVGNAADNALNNAAQAAFRDSQGVYSVDGKPLMNFAWARGSVTGNNRIPKAVDDKATAHDVDQALEAGRVERWLVNTDRFGNVAIGMLDENGRFIPQPRSRLFGGEGK